MGRVADPGIEQAFTELTAQQETLAGRAGGDIRAIYQDATYANTGMVWVDGTLFMIDMQKNFLLKYDTAVQALYDTVVIHNTPFGLTWDGEYLWIGDKVGNVHAYNLDGTPAGYSFSTPANGYSTLTWDGDYFLTNFILENDPVIYRIDETGAVVQSFQTDLDKMNIWQLVFVDEHFFYGEIWFTNNSGVIGQVALENGQGIMITEFPAPASVSYALTHDNTDLWYGKAGGVLYRVDDGINEVNWLKVEPAISAVPAASQKEVNLQFDASGFEEGVYHANLVIISNDQDEQQIRVPVDLYVTGIDLGADTSFCGNLSVLLDAGDGFAGYLWSDGSQGQTVQVDSIGYGLGSATIWVDVTDIGGSCEARLRFGQFPGLHEHFRIFIRVESQCVPEPEQGAVYHSFGRFEKGHPVHYNKSERPGDPTGDHQRRTWKFERNPGGSHGSAQGFLYTPNF